MENVFIRHFELKHKKYSKATVALVYKPDKGIITHGISACSTKDQYNRKVGNSIAVGRANRNPFDVVKVGNNFDKKTFVNFLFGLTNADIERAIVKQSRVHKGDVGVSKIEKDGYINYIQ